MLRTRLPKLPPVTIVRPSLQTWFDRHAQVPLRVIAAPAGSGKTTAIVNFLGRCERPAAYCSLLGADTRTEVRTRLASALGLGKTPASYSETLDLIAYEITSPFELAIDDIDDITPEALNDLMRLVQDGPQTLSLTYVSRARLAVRIGRQLSQGLAALCDAGRLAFSEADVQQFCDASNVDYTHSDVVRLLDATEGWAIVTTGAIRSVAAEGRSLENAFDIWRRSDEQGFEQFFSESLESSSQEQRALMRSLIAGVRCEDEDRLQGLEDAGLYVVREPGGLRPYRALTLLNNVQPFASSDPHSAAEIQQLQVRSFGRFQAEIGAHPIPWIRRRDQEVFKYIALKDGGTVGRAELANVFWPGAEPHLVAQSVRTACSNIRKAISRIVGYGAVESYFRVGVQISIDLKHVVVDVRRFTSHADEGELQYKRNELQAANAHYRIAERLYAGRLFIGDAEAAWSAARACELEERFLGVLERLSEIARELGDVSGALLYAQRIIDLRPQHPAARARLAKGDDLLSPAPGFMQPRVVEG